MAVYRVTVKRDGFNRRGDRILQRGMSVEVVSDRSPVFNPLLVTSQEVNDAFFYKYGIDLGNEGLLNGHYLDDPVDVNAGYRNGNNNFYYNNNVARGNANSGCGCFVFVFIFATSLTLLLL